MGTDLMTDESFRDHKLYYLISQTNMSDFCRACVSQLSPVNDNAEVFYTHNRVTESTFVVLRA